MNGKDYWGPKKVITMWLVYCGAFDKGEKRGGKNGRDNEQGARAASTCTITQVCLTPKSRFQWWKGRHD